ncbi:class I SAM-dependent rRNA methyltransferase [Rhodobacteraceae bacterium RKSG542]|nr:class I SAM-dependent rRNA methyltransferase [Pseudovibrio flavus]
MRHFELLKAKTLTTSKSSKEKPVHEDTPVSVLPSLLEMKGWKDYALLDMGNGQKLERYGRFTVVRPEQQAMGTPRLPESQWARADAVFTGDMEEEGPGRWRFSKQLPETWKMQYGPVTFNGRFMSFRHVGVFPEQAAHWDWVQGQIKKQKRQLKVLNLFGYTGLASLLPAAAGAHVTHVDASKKAIGWARENQALSGMEDLPIRWICEDAMKFVQREVRRGSTYDGIILDPPKYGRGTKGEVWDFFECMPEMLHLLRQLLSPDAQFMLLSSYAIRASFIASHELMREHLKGLPGTIESGELVIREENSSRMLSTSLFCRWSAPDRKEK